MKEALEVFRNDYQVEELDEPIRHVTEYYEKKEIGKRRKMTIELILRRIAKIQKERMKQQKKTAH